jgi:hypothetical protein
MRKAATYRGARRNNYVSPAAKQTRFFGWNAWEQANTKANLEGRAQLANAAREAASRALVNAGVLAQPSIAVAAMLDFYRDMKPPRSRVVNRIIRELKRQMPPVRQAA